MGFPSVCYCVILPQPLVLVLQLLDLLRHAFLLGASAVGLAAPPTADEHPAAYGGYAPPAAAAAMAVPSELVWAFQAAPEPAAIKARLPAVRYADLRCRRGSAGAAAASCAVCLGALEARHRVRELGNCAHAFHKACIDKWVDKGQATCPLCRAALLPASDDDAIAATCRHLPSSSSAAAF
ncbi:brassinosteroid-responsive RING protein 1-like [Oryza brachyantha]|uniref:brassinosteroid-responsive RING protein 1-like n=1 Tax=Oryza brachyantha TaxID=4533 RepID=UPI001ADCEE36|nr:brassinosteroid-responsive RING protein 1-like [Oryza brachyantha]